MPNKKTVASVGRCHHRENKREICTVSTARGNIAPMEEDINPKYLPDNCFKGEKPLSSPDIF